MIQRDEHERPPGRLLVLGIGLLMAVAVIGMLIIGVVILRS